MADSNAIVFPIGATNLRISFRIDSLSTELPQTGGLGTLAAQISADGANFANCQNAPVEILGSGESGSGYGYLDLDGSEMPTYSGIVRIVSTTVANTSEFSRELVCGGAAQIAAISAESVWDTPDFGPIQGRAVNVGQQLAQVWRRHFNMRTDDGSTFILYGDDNATILLQASIIYPGAGAVSQMLTFQISEPPG